MGSELDGSPSPKYPVSIIETRSISSTLFLGGIFFPLGRNRKFCETDELGNLQRWTEGSELWIVERKLLCAALVASLSC